MNLTAVEFRRGWPVLLAAALGTACGATPIRFNSIGPFTKPLSEEFGWGRGDIQLALFGFTMAVVLTVPFVGGLADRIGVRKVAIGTLTLFGLCFAALALTLMGAGLTAAFMRSFATCSSSNRASGVRGPRLRLSCAAGTARRVAPTAQVAPASGPRGSSDSGLVRENVRGMNAAPGAPKDGFTAFSRATPGTCWRHGPAS